MSVPAKDFHKVMEAPASKIFAVIASLYGTKMADEIAKEVINPSNTAGPVVWPTF